MRIQSDVTGALRILGLGAHFDTTQSWTGNKLRQIVLNMRSDPLALVNVIELISQLPSEIIKILVRKTKIEKFEEFFRTSFSYFLTKS